MSRRALLRGLAVASCALAHVSVAGASDFDPLGNHAFDPTAVHTESFEHMPSWSPVDPPAGAVENLYVLTSTEALDGVRVGAVEFGSWRDVARVPVPLPPVPGSYRARLWVRGGEVGALFVAPYQTRRSRVVVAELAETGRCTSDGWVELASAAFSVDGADVTQAFLELHGAGQIDAFELVPDGVFAPEVSCLGAFDPACGSEAVCIDEVCRPGAQLVPHLPAAGDRDRVVDLLRTRIDYFFGGYRTRRDHLPAALEQIERMRAATSSWAFWHGFATAVRMLGDWHTSASGTIGAIPTSRVLNVCFLEGDADLSHAQWPPDPRYLDVMVSHVGADRTAGLRPGDRLVAVDGVHPIAWARSLRGVSWDWWQADDDRVNAEFVERMRGLIPRHTRTITVLRCNPSTDSCSSAPEVIRVTDLPMLVEGDAPRVQCDNRPAYHLVDGPNPDTHEVGYDVYTGLLADSQPGENLYGMTWDTLWGPSYTGLFKSYNEELKQSARGVILDHRAGNGGTIDAPEAITELVRTPLDIAIFIFDRPAAGYEGPATQQEGLAIFDRYKGYRDYPDLTYTVGSPSAKLDLPVALLLHRDGSASDYLPFGMKGAPKVRIFGPSPTAGAFSSYFEIAFPGGFYLRLASGDTIAFDGRALIGTGAEPDEIVLPLQSDLIHGRDTIYLRALQWVRSELQP